MRLKLPLAAVALFALTLSARGSITIRDDGGFFSDAARTQATDKLSAAPAKVFVVTTETPPEAIRAQVESADASTRGPIFDRYVTEQARQLGADVLVYANRNPAQLRIDVTPAGKRVGLGKSDQSALSQAMLAAFKSKNFDAGLTGLADALAARGSQPTNAGGAGGTLPPSAFPQTSSPRRETATPPSNPPPQSSRPASGLFSMGPWLPHRSPWPSAFSSS